MVSFVNKSIYENEAEFTYYSEYEEDVPIPELIF